ncbi:acetyl/propionyl/methylcrotonyl-CoA carboxylase subunit alpha [Sphingomonas sp. IC-11]|uniref:acetyl-CoA carboxylase biotin carboxylase subunit n=1 Tax=Sphingomonas sp. IC-11 TaxID=2898528 RepID=UPI001E291984|nr:acetyl/propionyl/methylcrotonyl-CoA carboxylase subunit alpha [Sphingomonas sp. IC-11]
MFGKILIANRGEIACRIIRTAQRMGIGTVAVYSDADARAPHVSMADEAIRIGEAPASESYLDADRILAAARATGADAIHPGYGFLSERASFAEACAAAGIAFIGPPPTAIAAMGDKIASKEIARAAGVNVVPGHPTAIENVTDAARIAAAIGYPVMVKASAGGGGKGMRLARDEAEIVAGFDATRREALASFGDDRVLIEKFIERPRHIEIQVLGDQHGNVVYLGERECSVQRRHQKVVEEAPSPFVTPAMRRAMGEQAIALARAVGYHSAGTVELIVSGADPSGESFYFLEMNTRLQVEHPVTEAVTGFDLVEQMIRVAAGERLAFSQADVHLNGWAVETRIYAEDPYRGFLPSTGRLVRYRRPGPEEDQKADGNTHPNFCVRVDDGVAEGGEVSRFYDPMIAKLITWGPTRETAVAAQVRALDAFEIEGLATNIDFLSALMQHPRFRRGDLTTGFIEEEYPRGFNGAPTPAAFLKGLAALAVLMTQANARGAPEKNWSVRIGERDFAVTLSGDAVAVDGEDIAISHDYAPGRTIFRADLDGEEVVVQAARTLTGFILHTRGARHKVRVLPQRIAGYTRHLIDPLPANTGKIVTAPMPGLLVRLDVSVGENVAAGQALGVIEAMKMENVLRAEADGTVAALRVAAGESVVVDQVLIELE